MHRQKKNTRNRLLTSPFLSLRPLWRGDISENKNKTYNKNNNSTHKKLLLQP